MSNVKVEAIKKLYSQGSRNLDPQVLQALLAQTK